LAALPGGKVRLGGNLVRPILARNQAYTEMMEQRLGQSLTDEDRPEDDHMTIHDEQDLLRVEDETTQWLAAQLGPEHEKEWEPGLSAHRVAGWTHTLRLKLASQDTRAKEAQGHPSRRQSPKKVDLHNRKDADERAMATLDPLEMARSIRSRDPEACSGVPDDALVRVVHYVFQHLAAEVGSLEQGLLRVPGLGSFRVRQVSRDTRDDQMEVIFRPFSENEA
jgi:hypothetical protein